MPIILETWKSKRPKSGAEMKQLQMKQLHHIKRKLLSYRDVRGSWSVILTVGGNISADIIPKMENSKL